jgi:hypothetical protein
MDHVEVGALPPVLGVFSSRNDLVSLEHAFSAVELRKALSGDDMDIMQSCVDESLRLMSNNPYQQKMLTHGLSRDMAASILMYVVACVLDRSVPIQNNISLFRYTFEGPLYNKLNAALRKEDRNAVKPYFPYLRLLITAMAKLKKEQGSEDRTLNRGVNKELVLTHPDVYRQSQTLRWWPFSSCTKQIEELETKQFMGTEGERTLFQITTSKGVDVSDFSAVKREAEVLLPPGISLRIGGILRMKDGLTIVTLADDNSKCKTLVEEYLCRV